MSKQEIIGKSVFDGATIRIIIEDGRIGKVERVEDSQILPYVSPGFLDMQVNGFLGIDYSLENLESDQVKTLVFHLGKSGTTHHVPTFVTMPHVRLLRNLRITCEAIHDSRIARDSIVGFHIEGPFISPEDGPRGAHDKKFVREADFRLFEEWQEAAEGLIKLVTVAPETKGALDFIKAVAATGVKVAIGHTGASPEQIHEAIQAGATISTHLGNGSYTQIPRLRNYIWEQLAADELHAGIICDGYHLPRSVVKVFARAKGLERLILVSDVALLGGYSPGIYKWGDLDVEVFKDGHLGLPGTTVLAGAAHLLDWDIARFMEFTGCTLPQAISLCTRQPAKYLGLDTKAYEDFIPGKEADLCLFNYKQGDQRLHVARTMLAGVDLF
jgi:N-acetylglucosamine-6-phosphate deacetylase